jgi:hypothetical protein
LHDNKALFKDADPKENWAILDSDAKDTQQVNIWTPLSQQEVV